MPGGQPAYLHNFVEHVALGLVGVLDHPHQHRPPAALQLLHQLQRVRRRRHLQRGQNVLRMLGEHAGGPGDGSATCTGGALIKAGLRCTQVRSWGRAGRGRRVCIARGMAQHTHARMHARTHYF